MTAGGWVVEAEGVAKAYDHRPVLRGVDLRVRAGESLGILGANGSGKTTLLRVIATLVPPSRGRLALFGQPAAPRPEIRRRLGLVPHESLLYDNLTVEENLRFFAVLYGVSTDRLERVLAEAWVRPLAGRRVRVLSRGQRQQANLARALLHDPEVLLLDEPYTGLDITAAERLTALLNAERHRGRTVLFTTHDVATARAIADGLVVLLGGRLTETMAPAAVREDVLSAWFRDGRR